jgi:hypothetical protein
MPEKLPELAELFATYDFLVFGRIRPLTFV